MQNNLNRLKRILRRIFLRYRSAFFISFIASLAAITITAFYTEFTIAIPVQDPQELSLLLLLLLIVLMLIFIIFSIRRRSNIGSETTTRLLHDIFGPVWQNTQFYARKNHFSSEKDFLGLILAEDIFPPLLDDIYAQGENGAPKQIDIIIDSGTTLAPTFRHLPRSHIKERAGEHDCNIAFHTNSLAGVEELYKTDMHHWKLAETDFTLIDGHPLGTYRATTYNDNEHPYLQKLWKTKNRCVVGVLTANWILVGAAYDTIVLCARGKGHPQFKAEVAKKADILLIVGPLGKFLRLDSVDRLNALLPAGEDHYTAVELDESKRERTYLITTFRKPRTGISVFPGYRGPLLDHSINMQAADRVGKNFTFWKNDFLYAPPGPVSDVSEIEVPHEYLRGSNFRAAFGYEWHWR